MNIKSRNLIPLAVATLILGSCTTYSKVIKSDDRELMYQEALKLYDAKKLYKVITLSDLILPRYYGTEREDSIAYLAAASNYKLGHFSTSAVLCDNFRRRFPRSVFTEDIEYMYAKGFYYMSPAPDRDHTNTAMAISTINEFLSRYPDNTKKDELLRDIAELMNRLHDKSFINAKVYFDIGSYKSASVALRNALDEYPDSPHRQELLYLTVKSDYMLAYNSVEDLKRDRYLDMMDSYYTYASEYPGSKQLRELDKMLETAKDYIAATGSERETTPAS